MTPKAAEPERPIDWKAVQAELQGSSGLISRIRSTLLSGTLDSATEVFSAYCDEVGQVTRESARSRFSSLLGGLLDFSTRVYYTRADLVATLLIQEIEKHEELRERYPESFAATDRLRSAYSRGGSFESFVSHAMPLITGLVRPINQSERQSGLKRAALLFSDYIARLVQLAGFDGNFDRRVRFSPDAPPIDFAFPPESSRRERMAGPLVVAGAITTVNDRYRISVQKLAVADAPHKFLLTGVGSSFPHAEPDTLSPPRLSHLSALGIRVVVLETALKGTPRLRDQGSVISYEQWVQELDRILNMAGPNPQT